MDDVTYIFEIYPDFVIMLECLLIGFVIALVGAGGYTFFVSSMNNDRREEWGRRFSNPWDKLSGEDNTPPPKRRISKPLAILLVVLLAIVVVLSVLLIAIKSAWI